jgi:ribosome-binding protein aMBF1 (putative translation factor)
MAIDALRAAVGPYAHGSTRAIEQERSDTAPALPWIDAFLDANSAAAMVEQVAEQVAEAPVDIMPVYRAPEATPEAAPDSAPAFASVGESVFVAREQAAMQLEALAERVRSGELELGDLAPNSSDASVLAATLSALLKSRG